MKKIILLFCAANFMCCHQLIYQDGFYDRQEIDLVSEETTVDLFWEWGELKISGTALHVKKALSLDSLNFLMSEDRFCSSFYDIKGKYLGSRFFLSDDSLLSYECLYAFAYVSKTGFVTKDFLENTFNYTFMRRTEIFDQDSVYRVVYWGDSLKLKSKELYGHRLTSQTLKFYPSYVVTDTMYGTKKVHEFYLIKAGSTHSVVVETDSSLFRGKKLLNVDSSVLLLESPKYKALRRSLVVPVPRPLSEMKKCD